MAAFARRLSLARSIRAIVPETTARDRSLARYPPGVRKAAIDVGSNSVLLVVEERTEGGWKTVFESTAITALGDGTKTSGVLGEPGITATLEALKSMFAVAHKHGAEEVIAAATMAARIASNTDDLLARAKAQGTPVFVLSGEDEAQLGFRSVASDPTFANQARLSIVDPGGHSTEMLTADRLDAGWEVKFRRSYPVGTLGLRSGLLHEEAPDTMALLRASREIDDVVGLSYRPNEAGTVVVLGATGTNLVSMRDKLKTWEPEKVHGAVLDYEEVSKATGWLMKMTDAERGKVVGIEPGREKTIHIGALILERFMFALRAHSCMVSVRGWRHALLEEGLPQGS
jgi:exopolyphosphatase / guanosine-5'-triphosphate,3'-diphosphate pyrophosphatase